jgi:mRNA interferase MazF
MSINFHPRAGQLLMCDLTGFREPEMVKVRPVIVISPRLPHRSNIVTVVPVSLSAPTHDLPFVYKLSRNYHPGEKEDLDCWAKCDMLMNISRERLDGFKVGRRQWKIPEVSISDLNGIRCGVLHGLGMGHLIPSSGNARFRFPVIGL